MLLEYFSQDIRHNEVGSRIGMEIETDFTFEAGTPISTEVTSQLLMASPPGPWQTSLELGRQKIELALRPHRSFESLYGTAMEALNWLYEMAASFGAVPFFGPELEWSDDLLWIQEERDQVWVQLDGQPALEELCRCSSVQFTIDVSPEEAIGVINRLLAAQVLSRDYSANDRRWKRYVKASQAGYLSDRYGGPEGFENLQDYIRQLMKHPIVMHKGAPCNRLVREFDHFDVDLFLRSVWWHYRLRRYGSNLAVEIRPFSRRSDDNIKANWQLIVEALNL